MPEGRRMGQKPLTERSDEHRHATKRPKSTPLGPAKALPLLRGVDLGPTERRKRRLLNVLLVNPLRQTTETSLKILSWFRGLLFSSPHVRIVQGTNSHQRRLNSGEEVW